VYAIYRAQLPFPPRRSSDLTEPSCQASTLRWHQPQKQHQWPCKIDECHQVVTEPHAEGIEPIQRIQRDTGTGHDEQNHALNKREDRKSTRLNSSHVSNSYDV